MRLIRRRAMIAGGVLLLAAMAMAQPLREGIADIAARGMDAVQTLAWSYAAQAQITLPERTVYALQLGAYDNGEHAQREMVRLCGGGTLCVIWQRAQMRLVCDAAESRERLNMDAAQGADAWVIRDELPKVVLRIDADAGAIDAVRDLLTLPDTLFAALGAQEEEFAALVASAREAAQKAQGAHPENALYTQLAQSLVNWCNLMDSTVSSHGEAVARSYARVTMYTLCCELRQALIAESTASAQRTPSTAADVMPPA